jgi:hypothetical protein
MVAATAAALLDDPAPLARDLAVFLSGEAPPRGDEHGEAAFDVLARRVFVRQYARNAPYRAFCDGRGVTPETVASWRNIPAAPAAAFKRFALTCAPEDLCQPEKGGRVFCSSGTTGSQTSRHYLDRFALDLYRVSLREGYRRLVFPGGGPRLPVFALAAPPEDAPHSSLSFMLNELIADDGGRFFHGPSGWQADLADALRVCATPVVVFGTAFAFVHFFDASRECFALPAGSRVIETGGFKGRSREVRRDELYGLFTQRLGVPATHCLSEYGMSEMASQFYDSTLVDHVRGAAARAEPPRKVAPFWLRTRVVDPVTGTEAEWGAPGLLAHYDLANLNSVLAIQTEDYGYAVPGGGGFCLLGRAPGAALRGCSLSAEGSEQEKQGNVPRPPNRTP